MQINKYFFKICVLIFSFPQFPHLMAQLPLNTFWDTDKMALTEAAKFRSPLSPNEVLAGENMDVIYHKFNWFIDPNKYFIRGSVQTNFRALSDLNTITLDCANALVVDSVLQRQQKLVFDRNTTNILSITLSATVTKNAIDSVVVFYHGVPPSNGFGSFANRIRPGNHAELWTLSEPYGGRDWWPGKMDLLDKIDSVDIYVTTPKQYRCGSNGILVSETLNNLDSTVTYFWKHRYPIANYLIGIAVTDYRQYVDVMPLSRGDTLNCLNYVYTEAYDAVKPNSFKIKYAMRLYDSIFAPYPFKKEKYGMAQFGWAGGQEHQTMSFVYDLTNIDLCAHELSHHWFGDKITCGSWRDIWLNEGFATYCTGLYYENVEPAYWLSWRTQSLNNATRQTNGSVYVDDTTSVNRIFSSALSYNKGARVLHYLRYVLGDSIFFKAIREYITDPKLVYNYARTQDLINHFQSASGKDLTDFFKVWFYGEGYPSVNVEYQYCLSDAGTTKELSLKLSENTSAPNSVKFFPLKLPIKLKFASGADTTLIINYSDSTLKKITFGIKDLNSRFSKLDTVIIDPEYWLLTKGNTSVKSNAVCSVGTNDIQNIKLSVYPNPAQSEINFELPSAVQNSSVIEIYNALGQIVSRETVRLNSYSSSKSQFSIKVSGFTNGFYSVRTVIDDKNYFATFVKN